MSRAGTAGLAFLGKLLLVFLCFSGLLWRPARATCTLPNDLVGSWYRISDDVIIDFTSSTSEGQEFPDYDDSYDCYESSGNRYVFATASVANAFGGTSIGYYCWKIVQQTDATFLLYMLTEETNSATFGTGEIVEVRDVEADPDLSDICTLSSSSVIPTMLFTTSSGSIDTSDISTAEQPCSSDLFKNYTYVKDGAGCSGSETELDFCNEDDHSTAVVDYNLCATKILYSDDGVLSCLADVSVSGVDYQFLVNQDTSVDDSSNYRFICVKLTSSSSFTVYAKECDGSTSHTLTVTAQEACPSDDSSGGSSNGDSSEDDGGGSADIVPIAAGVGAGVVVIIVIVVIVLVYIFVISKRKMRAITPVTEKPPPNDSSVNTEESEVTSGDEDITPTNEPPGRLPPLTVDAPRSEPLRY